MLNRMCIIRILHICTMLDKQQNGENHFSWNEVDTRVFLSAYLIFAHPKMVFDYFNDLVNALVESAKSMLVQYELICEVVCKKEKDPQKLLESTNGFLQQVFSFMERFKRWKKPDEKFMISRIKTALFALIEARRHTPDADPIHAKNMREINFQINRLRNKMIHIAGREVLDEFDKETEFASRIEGIEHQVNLGNPDHISQMKKRMSNEELAHELLLDPTFVLTMEKAAGCQNAVDVKIKQAFNRAFWKSIADDLRYNPPIFRRILRVLQEVRDGTAELCTQRHVQEKIFEVLDISFIETQLENNTFGWDSCIMMVQATFKVFMQVEEKDFNEKTIEIGTELVAKMKGKPNDPEVFTETLEAMLQKLNEIRVQSANKRLRAIAHVVLLHGIDYERGKMREKLESGQLTLDNLKRMVGQSLQELNNGNDLEMARVMGNGNNVTLFHTCHAKFMVNVLNTKPLHSATCPETLLFDMEKCLSYQKSIFYLTTAATTSALLRSFSRESKVNCLSLLIIACT